MSNSEGDARGLLAGGGGGARNLSWRVRPGGLFPGAGRHGGDLGWTWRVVSGAEKRARGKEANGQNRNQTHGYEKRAVQSHRALSFPVEKIFNLKSRGWMESGAAKPRPSARSLFHNIDAQGYLWLERKIAQREKITQGGKVVSTRPRRFRIARLDTPHHPLSMERMAQRRQYYI